MHTLQTTDFVTASRRYTQLPKLFRWFSEHCVLRSPEESDVMHIWNAAKHPHYAKCWTGAAPASLDEVAHRVHKAMSEWSRGNQYALAVHRKSTQEFVGWIDLIAHPTQKGAWLMQWFVHPRYVADPIAQGAIGAAMELMFRVLDAQTLYARIPAGHQGYEQLVNEAGFIEIAPAGSLDATTQRPRSHGVFEMRRMDWMQMYQQPSDNDRRVASGNATTPSWVVSGLRNELELV